MKVSVFFPTHNKNSMLPNALYSLSIQKTSFDWELCVVDDHSDVSPEPIIKEFFPNAKFVRYPHHIGFIHCHDACFDLANNPEVVVLQSTDVIHTRIDSLQILVSAVTEKTISIAEVVDMPIDSDFYKTYDVSTKNILTNWDSYKTFINLKLGNRIYACSTQYTSLRSPLFFLGAIMKKDLDDIDYKECNCDAVTHKKLKEAKFKINFLNHIKAIHQRHPKTTPKCPIINECDVFCIRKEKGFEYES